VTESAPPIRAPQGAREAAGSRAPTFPAAERKQVTANLTSDHPAVRRAAARLRKLGRKHHIRALGGARYEVISGRSGAVYLVSTGSLSCECEAGRLGRFCDHKLVALMFERMKEETGPTRAVAAAAAPEPEWKARWRELRASGRLFEKRNRRGRVIETILDGMTI
jgi:hypothetical protein